MSGPYTSKTIVAFNASPPPNDGSEVASNDVDWDFHINKIGTPLKNLAEGINTNVLAAFNSIYGMTQAENDAPVTIVNWNYLPGNVSRYGTNTIPGTTDMTTASQAALNTGHDVIFPDDKYLISSSLSVGTQRVTGLGNTGSFRQTDILPNGDFPAFINKTGVFVTFDIDGFFIDYGPTTPTVAAGNDNKIGFKFTGAQFPQISAIQNCSVRGAWYGFFDDSGSYEFLLERIRTDKCRTGFYKQNGTTIHFNNCGGGNGQQEFVCIDTLDPVLTNCSADGLTITATTPNQTGNYFSQCPGLTITGMDCESNSIAGDGSSFMKFSNIIGKVSGFCGITNTLAGSGTDQINFFHVVTNSRVKFSGVRVPGLTSADLLFTGTGHPYTLYLDNSSTATLISSSFGAVTGGSPTTLHSVGGASGASITLINTFADQLRTETVDLTIADEIVTATNVITADETGKTFYLGSAGGFTSTLPAPAIGLKFKFIVSTAPTTAYIITTNGGDNILEGTYLDIIGELVAIAAQDTLNFVASTSLVGDTLEVKSDGTSWFCTALSKADGGITVSVT